MSTLAHTHKELLRKISEALESLDPAELEKLARPEYRAEIVVKRVRSARFGEQDISSHELVAELVGKLEHSETRAQAEQLLQSQTRDSLQAVLRAIDVPFQKKHSKEDLVEIVVENTIGFRLRSEAISRPG